MPESTNATLRMTNAYRSNSYCIAVGFPSPNSDRKSGSELFQKRRVSAGFSFTRNYPNCIVTAKRISGSTRALACRGRRPCRPLLCTSYTCYWTAESLPFGERDRLGRRVRRHAERSSGAKSRAYAIRTRTRSGELSNSSVGSLSRPTPEGV